MRYVLGAMEEEARAAAVAVTCFVVLCAGIGGVYVACIDDGAARPAVRGFLRKLDCDAICVRAGNDRGWERGGMCVCGEEPLLPLWAGEVGLDPKTGDKIVREPRVLQPRGAL